MRELVYYVAVFIDIDGYIAAPMMTSAINANGSPVDRA